MSQSDDLILVINCGSSSLKFAFVAASGEQVCSGLAEKIGGLEAKLTIERDSGKKDILFQGGHQTALLTLIEATDDLQPIAVGHRVVHGGEHFSEACLIDAAALEAIQSSAALAPLHNPANLVGIEAASQAYAQLKQVAVFDTAFHQSMPARAYRYALPKHLYTEHGIRRYGFHGTSHNYVSARASQLTQRTGPHGWVCAHLGNGASTCAVYEGKSVDTSMGLTPLEGLVMGTRSGSVDPSLPAHLIHTLGLDIDAVDNLLNKQSGLLGLSGVSNDMRTLTELAADPNSAHQQSAALAIEVFCYQAAQSISAMICALPTFTGVLFTGGIGENAAGIRSKICGFLTHFGVQLDPVANADRSQPTRQIDASGAKQADDCSGVEVWVIPTDEEGQIAKETRALI